MNIFFNEKEKILFFGFTLVELLISMSIIAVVSVISIVALPKFNQQISLVTETYKILAFIRETQSFGVAAFTEPGKKIAYGFKFEKSSQFVSRMIKIDPTDLTNTYYKSNLTVDSSSVSPTHTILFPFSISKICYDECTTEVEEIQVIYKRPSSEARIFSVNSGNIAPDLGNGTHKKAEIYLKSKLNTGAGKKIVILQTGQMYVNDW